MRKTKNGKIIITKKEAKLITLKHGHGIHTFINLPSLGIIGADHSIESVNKDIDNAKELQITGKQALKLNHGLAIIPHIPCKQDEVLFVETIKEEVDKLLKKVIKK